MGRQSSDLIPFLRKALINKMYDNIRYASEEEDIFSVTLPRKSSSNTDWERPLKDWDKLKGRAYTDYSTSKQVFISALRRSLYLEDLKKHSKSTLLFRFLTSEGVAVKREAQKLGKPSLTRDSSDSEDIISPLSNASSGYVTDEHPEVFIADPLELSLNDLADLESHDSFPSDLSYLEENLDTLPSCDAVIESVFQKCDQMDSVQEPESNDNLHIKSLNPTSYAEGNHSQHGKNRECEHGHVIESRSKLWICNRYMQVAEYLQVVCEPLEFSSDIEISAGILFSEAILELTKKAVLIGEVFIGNCKVLIYKPMVN